MKVDSFLSFEQREIKKETIPFTLETRKWCHLPYPGHKHGCPNNCPATTPYQPEILTQYDTFFLFLCRFDFAGYKAAFQREKPGRTEKQYACVLYWQNAAKSRFADHVFRIVNRNRKILGCGSGFGEYPSMEAAGIDVFECLRRNNIPFEDRPHNTITLCALACLNDHQPKGLFKWVNMTKT